MELVLLSAECSRGSFSDSSNEVLLLTCIMLVMGLQQQSVSPWSAWLLGKKRNDDFVVNSFPLVCETAKEAWW